MKQVIEKSERINIRKVWPHEASHFTPWLARNLHKLRDTIGIDLELEAMEVPVGTLRADILAKDRKTGRSVIIENQLNQTDTDHLGRLIMYAVGLKATTIVWIAERFTNEHLAVFDWLNNNTASSVRFFGLQVEVWKQEEELTARFQAVCRPYSWRERHEKHLHSLGFILFYVVCIVSNFVGQWRAQQLMMGVTHVTPIPYIQVIGVIAIITDTVLLARCGYDYYRRFRRWRQRRGGAAHETLRERKPRCLDALIASRRLSESLLSSRCLDYLMADARGLYDDPVNIAAYSAGVLTTAARATIKQRREQGIAG